MWQVGELLVRLGSLTRELELLVDRKPASRPESGGRLQSAGAEQASQQDFTRHKSLNTPVRLNIGGKECK